MSDEGTGEPEVGSQEWLLQQLSGGRLTTRRQLREAEAAAAKAGIPLEEIPPQTGAAPTVEPAVDASADAADVADALDADADSEDAEDAEDRFDEPSAEVIPAPISAQAPAPFPAADDRPRARFSWNTGVLEPVDEPLPSEPSAVDAEPAEVPPVEVPPVELPPIDVPAAEILTIDDVPPADVPEAPATEDQGFTVEPAEHPLFVLPAEPEPEPDDGLAALGLTGEIEPLPEDVDALSSDSTPPREADGEQAVEEPEEPVFFWGLEPNGEADPIVAPRTELAASDDGAALEESAPEDAAMPDEPVPFDEPASFDDPVSLGAPVPFGEPVSFGPPALSDEPLSPDEPAPTGALAVQDLPTQALDAIDLPSPHEQQPKATWIWSEQPADEDDDEDEPSALFTPAAPLVPPVLSTAEVASIPATEPLAPIDLPGAPAPDEADSSELQPQPPSQPSSENSRLFTALAWNDADAEEPDYAIMVASGHAAEHAAAASGIPPQKRDRSTPTLLWIAAALVLVLVVIGLFALGRAFASPKDAGAATSTASSTHTSASPSPSATPSASTAIPATGPMPAGTWNWDQLRGGECLEPFTSPWAQTFTVVDCATPHSGQLVYAAPFSTDPNAAYPGQQQLGSQINLLCTKPGVLNLDAAGAYSDIQIVGAYPATEAQWKSGQRNYYCFVNRASGAPLAGSVQGSGPTS